MEIGVNVALPRHREKVQLNINPRVFKPVNLGSATLINTGYNGAVECGVSVASSHHREKAELN